MNFMMGHRKTPVFRHPTELALLTQILVILCTLNTVVLTKYVQKHSLVVIPRQFQTGPGSEGLTEFGCFDSLIVNKFLAREFLQHLSVVFKFCPEQPVPYRAKTDP